MNVRNWVFPVGPLWGNDAAIAKVGNWVVSSLSASDSLADRPSPTDANRMIRKITAPVLLALCLGGCSYSYDLIAAVRNGRIVINVDPASSRQPSCLRQIEVFEEGEREPAWLESVSYDDDCSNSFPLPYGHRLRGQHQPGDREVAAKPLRRETIYIVTATTGATGYGGGRFVVHADGRVENLPQEPASSGTGNDR